MASNGDFAGVFLKLERAEHHIGKLQLIFERWVQKNKKALRSKKNDTGRQTRMIGKPMPRHAPTILGDALHNLRASLDHCYCNLIQANGGVPNRHAKFPIRSDRAGCYSFLKGQQPPSKTSDTIANLILNDIQPYAGGNGDDLWALHTLDIADKHTNLISINTAFETGKITAAGLTIGSGLTLVSMGGNGNLLGITGAQNFRHQGDTKSSFNITFQEGTPFEGNGIIPTLKALQKSVTNTILRLEKIN